MRPLLLAFIGCLHLTRGTAVRHVRGVGLSGDPVPVTHAAVLSNVKMLTGAAVTDGHRIELGLNGDGTYERMLADLAAAHSAILLQVYYGNSGHLVERLGQLFPDRARTGVAVLVSLTMPSAGRRCRTSTCRRCAMPACGWRPSARFSCRRSTWCRTALPCEASSSTGRIAWTGGFGIDDKWLGDGRANGSWRETNVRFEGPAVRQMQAAFAVAWTEATGG